MFFLGRRVFLLVSLPDKPYLFSAFLFFLLSWTFNMLTKARRVWDVGLGLFADSLGIAWYDLGVNSQWMCFSGKIGKCPESFPLVNNLPYYRIMDLKLFGNGLRTLPRLTSSYNCFSKVAAEVINWSTPNDQLIKCIWPAALTSDCYLLLIPVEAVKVHLVCHTLLLHYGFDFVQ